LLHGLALIPRLCRRSAALSRPQAHEEKACCRGRAMTRATTRISVARMREHIFELWGGEDEIEWCKRPSQAWALRAAGVIRIPQIKSAISYATALHEIGHIRGRHQDSKSVMVRERWAWKWARANALFWTPAMEDGVRRDLKWYASGAAKIDKGWKPATTETIPNG
jgi:hypothetical protein